MHISQLSRLPRRVGLLLCILVAVWFLTLLSLSIQSGPSYDDPAELKEEILRLSDRYVRALARETRDVVDGPYTSHNTGYDLKKTMAVLLENILLRMSSLERQVEALKRNGSVAIAGNENLVDKDVGLAAADKRQEDGRAGRVPQGAEKDNSDRTGAAGGPERKMVNAKDLLMGALEDCSLTPEEQAEFPHCQGKSSWMSNFWKSDPCYAENGVDGSQCSFRFYLSEVEHWCPLIPGRRDAFNRTVTQPPAVMAEWNFNLDGLLEKLRDPPMRRNYEWIRMRVTRLWDRWVSAAKQLNDKKLLQVRNRKKILVHLGLLSVKSGFHIAETALKGGPLGELVQWSDIISALHILGHDLTITSEVDELSRILETFPSAESLCQTRTKLPMNMIYTDIVGLTQFKRKVKQGYGKFSCLLRIIDSFGTEAQFNHELFAKSNHLKTQWGMQNLNLKQFFTMFPHSPDNSFMGFVVEQHINESEFKSVVKRNQAVVYGKDQRMWEGKEPYLSVIKKYVDIHATVFLEPNANSIIPSFVVNHGILKGPELHKLLAQSKLFIGLGFPYEGPAPLEAIAQGCVFINPKFNPPHNSANTKFFKGKPTYRPVTSQHPYTEDFIGAPYVQTIDTSDLAELERVIKQALKDVDEGKADAYLPYEFTNEGMLQRLNAYIQHQDFCNPLSDLWPPLNEVNITAAKPGKSCKTHCWETGQICEPTHFKRLNKKTELEHMMGAECSEVKDLTDVYYPAYDPTSKHCVLQKDPLMFSCVGEVAGLVRLCPCREYIRGQTALCPNCL